MTKRVIGFLLLCSITFVANAQLLWKISGNGLTQPSYIMGTHHLAPLSITDSIQGLPAAFAATKQMYGELVMSDMQNQAKMAEIMQKYMTTTSDTTFQSLFTPKEYERINQYVKELLQFDIAMMPKLKPAFLSNNLLVMLYMKHVGGFNPQEQIDSHFQSEAATQGKKINGLETLDFQLDLLYNKYSLQRQAKLLLCMLNSVETSIDHAQRLTNAYMSQNLEELQQMADENDPLSPDCDFSPTEKAAMVTQRNNNWASKLPAIMSKAPTFIAIGVLHLTGEQGILNLLKKEGYTLEPVK